MTIFPRVLIGAIFATVLIAAGASAGKAPQRFGESIDPKAPRVSLGELLASPASYAGKHVVVEGNFAGKCCAADFFFKDKLDMIEATPPAKGQQCMLLKPGTPIRLYGRVNVIQREAAKGKKSPEPIVSIEGKGVEVREVPGKTTRKKG